MSKLGKLIAVFVLSASFAYAQTAEVVHNVNLRSEPSTNNPAITKLLPGAHLQLVDAAPVGGYYHVKTTAGQVGFVWGKNVQIEAAGNGPQPTPTQQSPLPQPQVHPAHLYRFLPKGTRSIGGSFSSSTRRAFRNAVPRL